MGTAERSSMSVTVFNGWGHRLLGPRLVPAQSKDRIRAPNSPPPSGQVPVIPPSQKRSESASGMSW